MADGSGTSYTDTVTDELVDNVAHNNGDSGIVLEEAHRFVRRAAEQSLPEPPPMQVCRQVFERMAGCWTHWGKSYGYFKTQEDADAFQDEMCYMLARQMAAPNSPQWFNTGLNWAYGITGPAQGHFYCDPDTGELIAGFEIPGWKDLLTAAMKPGWARPIGFPSSWTGRPRTGEAPASLMRAMTVLGTGAPFELPLVLDVMPAL